MPGFPRRYTRAAFAVVILCTAGAVVGSYATAGANLADTQSGTGPAGPSYGDVPIPTDDGAPQAPAAAPATAPNGSTTPETRLNRSRLDGAGNLTVVATQGFYVSDEEAELVAFDREGEVVYYDAGYRVYFDVDPVPGTRATVEYLASRHLEGAACTETPRCTYNVVRRVNLTTGEGHTVYGEVTPRIYSARWHDVDRINDTHLVIADIVRDSVRIVDTTDNETTWSWHASEAFDRSAGGQDGDWTHVNDVEVLEDGRVMVSVRNMDQVLFLDPGEGVQEGWTLGAENDYDVLYEQHNPDYVPPAEGGPAITVADSENGRVLEYQRVDPETGEPTTGPDGEWRRTWGWRDARLQWPRDADRLPNGNTLVVDTHGDRVVEVAPNGSVVWSRTVGMPYDAERLGTGDESTGGPSTYAAPGAPPVDGSGAGPFAGVLSEPDSRTVVTRPDANVDQTVWTTLKDLTPSLVVNGLLYAGPSWMRFSDLVFSLVALVTAACWGVAELCWSPVAPLAYVRALRRRVARLN